MSRRSVLLATTFYIAIGSLVAASPASAHGFGFGGFGGGGSFAFRAYGGGFSRGPMSSMGGMSEARYGHVPAIRPPAPGMNNGPSHVEPTRIPVSSGNGAHLPASEAGIASVPTVGRIGATGLSTRIDNVETGGRLPKSGSSEGVPNVTGDPRIVGQGQTPDHGPGISGVPSNGPTVNLPGSQGLGQKGTRVVPGYEGVGNGPQVNVPGSVDRHAPDEAAKALAKAEGNGKQLLNDATKGGPNSLNLPNGAGAGVAASDDNNGKTTVAGAAGQSVGSTANVPSAVGRAAGGAGLGIEVGGSVASGIAGSNGSGPNSDGGTNTVSTMQDGKTTIQVETTTDRNGNVTSMTYLEKGKNGRIIEKTTGPALPSKKNNETPNDDDTGTTTGSLNPSSGVGKTGHGGGTDNNGTETTTQATQLNGSVIGRTGHGDGTGNHGDNNTVDKSGALSANTSLARKDYGDGGGSDNRDGGTSLAAPKVGGGDPHQKAAAAIVAD